MKRTLFTCLVLAAVGICLLVSCAVQNDVPGEGDGIAYIRFGEDDRAFKADYDIQKYDNLYWFYTAEKVDSYGKTGETTEEAPVTAVKGEDGSITTVNKGLSGTIGPFSQGDWKFTLKAYAEITTDNKPDTTKLVYENIDDIKATLRGGETKSIPAEVKPAGDTGSLKFDGAYFKWQDGGSAAPLFKIEAYGIDKKVTYILTNDTSITGTNVFKIALGTFEEGKGYPLKYVLSNGTYTDTFSVTVDYYTCKITAYINGDAAKPVAYDGSFGFRIYGGATTVVSGDLVEKADSYATFDVKKTAIQSFAATAAEAKTIEVAVAPKAEAHDPTTENPKTNTSEVAFEAGALTAADATYCLSAETLSAETASDAFTIEGEGGGSAAVYGSIKLTLDAISGTTSTNVKDFGEKKVTVTTYIAPGLDSDDVTVKYNGEGTQPTDITYEPTTGKVTFKTTHFSDFVVASKKAAPIYNKSQNRYYSTFEDAVKNLGDTTELELKGEVTVGKTVTIKQNLSLDLGGKTITLDVTGDAFLLDASSDKAYTVEFKNGNIAGKTTNNGFTVKTNATLVLDAVTMDVECLRGVQIYQASNPAALEIKNKSSITVKDGYYAVATNASVVGGQVSEVDILIDNSTLKTTTDDTADDNTALLSNVKGNITINKSYIEGGRQAAILRGGTYEISDSEFKYRTNKDENKEFEGSDWSQGNGVPNAVIVIGNRGGAYAYSTMVTFEGTNKLNAPEDSNQLYVYQNNTTNTVTVTGAVDSSWKVSINGGAYYPTVAAKIGNYHYAELQEAIDAAQSGDTVEILRDISLTTKDNKAGEIIIKKSLTLEGNNYRIFNEGTISSNTPLIHIGETGNDYVSTEAVITLRNLSIENTGTVTYGNLNSGARLVNIWNITDTSNGSGSPTGAVTFENVRITSDSAPAGFRGISSSDNKNAVITLDRVYLSIPTYYAINEGYTGSNTNTTYKIVNSTINGWATINNWDNSLKVIAENSTFNSFNNYSNETDEETGEPKGWNDFSCIVVSQNKSGTGYGAATMEFIKCEFSSCIADGSNVKQDIFAIRNPNLSSTLKLEGCTLNPAANSSTFKVAGTNHTITVNGISIELE